MVGPCAKDKSTSLLIEGIVCDVNFTYSLEDTSGLPMDLAVRTDDGPELAVVSVDAVRPAKGRAKP